MLLSYYYIFISFYHLNVSDKPFETQLVASKTVIRNKEGFELNCTARANPKAGFSFFHNGKLVQNSTSHRYMINKAKEEHKGEYSCIPWNYYGEGPNVTVNIKVESEFIIINFIYNTFL
jgi:hypothetical protein